MAVLQNPQSFINILSVLEVDDIDWDIDLKTRCYLDEIEHVHLRLLTCILEDYYCLYTQYFLMGCIGMSSLIEV
ncbi:hypothetical protein C0W38_11805 [Photobacterium angustum]|uniref:Uncharacterized protein n=1 Tax=Photobacterium angustum TaxID=661 RepID=A0A855SCH0_PHOAN|nr:hypothetical protein UA33_18045 [Photobacterium angustum]KJG24136.1 hypothetical protein UA39_08170 [Photobacterium angustum]KJG31739.1 hypothetical protein UA36_08305 [Photobacterium angustum]KJG41242.1 hypothetical protein UA35_09235 [Photobacterium angustum]KJG49009.1 hypothetical protein UA30_09685 [Photobacterium angustum]